MTPWDEWWRFELTEDDSNPHIALLPLHPDVRVKFNETAAWEYAKSMIGKPYSYNNMIFSCIDIVDGNFPPPLDAHLVFLRFLYQYEDFLFMYCSLVMMHSSLYVLRVPTRGFDAPVASVMTMWNQLKPAYASDMWSDASNT
ncbi:hypothetical protein C5167_039276 [Papaver somniferum]|uniref:Uncharacterized protein n=1 Tax=Papaver somniferum TaxID=3469 RepID=A0A4Y7IE40_PAPSO|nr:hypothetical protein C5167_039276 [Papaver somniferum]